MPRIYTSPDPDLVIPERSIFTHAFSANYDPKLPAYIDAPTGKTLSRGDVHSQSLQMAWGMRNILGQQIGAKMAIFSPNSLWWPIVFLGGVAAGLCVTTINSAYTPSELAYNLKDSGSYLIFAHPALLKTTREALKSMGVKDAEIRKRIVLMGFVSPDAYKGVEDWQRVEQLLGRGQLDREVLFDGPAAHTTAIICYSSGTTSLPKGVELTHHNIVTQFYINMERFNFLHPYGPMLLAVLPFYHIYALAGALIGSFCWGTPEVIVPGFDPVGFCATIERYKVTAAFVVPPIMVMLANHPAPKQHDLRSLKLLLSAAAPLGSDLVRSVHARLKTLGTAIKVLQAYGLSETSPAINMLDQAHWESKMGTVGTLLPNVRARIVRDDGEDAAEGEGGELWVHGPNVMKGYLNNPKATQESITPDGWFKTGDIAVVDKDGYFSIVDRKKELIKYKGTQVPPAELEAVLLTHPKVVDSGVIGIYSEAEATEYPRAYIVPRGGVQSLKSPAEVEAFAQEVQTWIQTKVARHKYLRGGIVVVDAIPKSAAGKILRKDLRELAKRERKVVGTTKTKL